MCHGRFYWVAMSLKCPTQQTEKHMHFLNCRWYWHASIHSVCWICRANFITNVIVHMSVVLISAALWWICGSGIYQLQATIRYSVNWWIFRYTREAGRACALCTWDFFRQQRFPTDGSHMQNLSFIKLHKILESNDLLLLIPLWPFI